MTTDSTSGPAPARPGGTAGVSAAGASTRGHDARTSGDPRAPVGRLLGVDAARGLALAGMIAVHTVPDFDAEGRLTAAYAIAAGRASALFALLAGVGMGLLLASRARRSPNDAVPATRRALLRRAALLLILGLVLGSFASPPIVILAWYAVMFVLVVPFLGLGTRALIGLAAAWVLAMPVGCFALRTVVPDSPIVDPGLDSVLHPWALARELLLTGTYPALVWAGYLLVGLVVARLPLHRRTVQVWLLLGGAGVAVAARLLSSVLLDLTGGVASLPGGPPLPRSVHDVLLAGALGTTPTTDWRWLLVAAPHTGTPFDVLTTAGSALAVLGGCLLLADTVAVWALRPVAAMGAMTLTLYSLHVVALDVTLPWAGYSGAGLWLVHVLVALGLATAWSVTLGRGPLEVLSHRVAWGSSSTPVPRERGRVAG
ncbi:MAG: heparan-alpha-glucosaminide N-acetyltransferase domain-containing protein [Actinomycetales bacterium]